MTVKLILLIEIIVIHLFLFSLIFPPATDEIRGALKHAQFPTNWLNHYNLTELQTLGAALKSASDDGHIWVRVALGANLLVRQIVPISGLFHLQLLAGHVYGFTEGFLLCWSMEMLGSLVCYLLTWFTVSSHWYQQLNLWTFIQVYISRLDGFMVVLNEETLEFTQPIRTRTLSINLLATFRVLPLIPNWLINHFLVEIGVTPQEYLLSTAIGCLPGVFYSVHTGEAIEHILEDGISGFYLTAVGLLWVTVFGLAFKFI